MLWSGERRGIHLALLGLEEVSAFKQLKNDENFVVFYVVELNFSAVVGFQVGMLERFKNDINKLEQAPLLAHRTQQRPENIRKWNKLR